MSKYVPILKYSLIYFTLILVCSISESCHSLKPKPLHANVILRTYRDLLELHHARRQMNSTSKFNSGGLTQRQGGDRNLFQSVPCNFRPV